MVVKLVTENNICKGIIVLKDGKYEGISSDAVILATGGLGQIYKYTTNPIGATGDGFALAYDAGAVLRDMEFVQFHPTALAIDDYNNHNRFLISEAVRGEGAKLCDSNGFEYMGKYDIRKELAPRAIVARANYTQMKENNQPNVYLNGTNIIDVENRFPTIYKKCKEFGIDITKDFIPVAPASHYFMGGVKTDLNGETTVKNLYAVGEVASTGLHGANRLASNSLLECVVCAYKVAEVVGSKSFSVDSDFITEEYLKIRNNQINFVKMEKLKSLMWENVGIFRSQETLEKALTEIEKLEFDKPQTKEEYEFRNMLIVSKLIVKCALKRKESRGSHYRTDYLQTNEIGEHSEILKEKTYAK